MATMVPIIYPTVYLPDQNKIITYLKHHPAMKDSSFDSYLKNEVIFKNIAIVLENEGYSELEMSSYVVMTLDDISQEMRLPDGELLNKLLASLNNALMDCGHGIPIEKTRKWAKL